MPACSLAESLAAAERVRLAIAEPIEADGLRLNVTASIGVALHEPRRRTLDETIRAADLAVYSAKARGRNRVEAAPAEGTRSMS
jgi:diguanylate cyclase (GGDEF)-like protein